MAYLAGLFLGFFKMNLGIIFLKANVLGLITLEELDWITENENSFSRIDMALVIKLGRLMDEGLIELDCRKTA